MEPPHKGKADTYLTREGCEFRIIYVRSAFYTVKCYPFISYYWNIRKQPTGPYKESLFQVIFTLYNKALILQHLWSVYHFGKNTSRLAISFTLTIQSKTSMRISGKNRAIFITTGFPPCFSQPSEYLLILQDTGEISPPPSSLPSFSRDGLTIYTLYFSLSFTAVPLTTPGSSGPVGLSGGGQEVPLQVEPQEGSSVVRSAWWQDGGGRWSWEGWLALGH